MNTTQSTAVINDEITRHQVAANERMKMFPKYFPGVIPVEQIIYCWMDRLCLGYNGAYWEMYELSNGAFYMAPVSEDNFDTLCPGWGKTVSLSPDAAGLVVCLFAVNEIANRTGRDDLIALYHALKAYAFEHEEAGKIFQAID